MVLVLGAGSAFAELDAVSRGASDAHYLNEDLKDSRSNLRDAQRELTKCKSSLRKEESELARMKKEAASDVQDAKSDLSQVCERLCSVNCSEEDLQKMKIYGTVSKNLCQEIGKVLSAWRGSKIEVSVQCKSAIQDATARGCLDEKPVIRSTLDVEGQAATVAQWQARCDDLKEAVDDSQEEVDNLKEELSAARRACPNCELLEKMKPRTPGTLDYVLGALQTLAPTVMQGMAMNTWSGMIKDNANAWSSMYGQYMDYCSATGNPCMGPWSMMGYGGGGWGGGSWGNFWGSPFGGGPFGGFGGGAGGFGVPNPFGAGGGANGIPLGGNFLGGGFSPFGGPSMNANGMINGWGSPVSPFGTGFNSAVFPNGPWAGTGISMGPVAYPFGMGTGGMGGMGMGMPMYGMGGMGMGGFGMGMPMYGMPMTDFGMSGLGMGAGMWGGNPYGSGLWLGAGGLGGFGGGTGLNLWGGLNFNAGLRF